MVTKLYHIRSKKQFIAWVKRLGLNPKKVLKWYRGEGWYYHRGRGHISKYNPVLDKQKVSKHRSPYSRIGTGAWRHTNDLAIVKRKLRRIAKKRYDDITREIALDILAMIQDEARARRVKGVTKRRVLKAILPAVKFLRENHVDPYSIDWRAEIDLHNIEDSINRIMSRLGSRIYDIDVDSMMEAYKYYLEQDKERYREFMESGELPQYYYGEPF